MSVPPELLEFARQLRKDQTEAENLLWHLFRGRRFCGFKFRRQYPFGGYIIDFYCHEAQLAIELDGGQHNGDDRRLYDSERTKTLEGAGLRVLRFWNNAVFNLLDDVPAEIYTHLTTEKDNG